MPRIGKTQAAYFKMINDQGGINGRKINLIQYDDAYSPPKTVEQVRKLVESDEVLLTFQIIGTPSNAAVQKYLNAKKVPQLFAATGASKFTDPKNFPWTMGFNPNYFVEGRIYGQYILKNHPNAKIGILYQNDDLGKDYLNGLKAGLGDKAAKMIVAEASYESLRSDHRFADPQDQGRRRGPVLQRLDAEAGGAGDQEDRRARLASGAHRRHQRHLGRRRAAAGRPRSFQGRDQRQLRQGSARSDLEGRRRHEEIFRLHGEVLSRRRQELGFNTYGYSTAQLLVHVLKQCGDDLTRENIMKQAATLKNVELDLALPGMKSTPRRTTTASTSSCR